MIDLKHCAKHDKKFTFKCNCEVLLCDLCINEHRNKHEDMELKGIASTQNNLKIFESKKSQLIKAHEDTLKKMTSLLEQETEKFFNLMLKAKTEKVIIYIYIY